jgi:hypothetical protein
MIEHRGPSLFDTIGRYPVDWWFIYSDMDDQSHWHSRLFKSGFQHVKALRQSGRVWVLIESSFSFVDIQLIREDATPWQMFPHCTIQHVNAMRRCSDNVHPFHVGPLSCVELMKALLGVRAWRVRTPWQFYRYCKATYEHKRH